MKSGSFGRFQGGGGTSSFFHDAPVSKRLLIGIVAVHLLVALTRFKGQESPLVTWGAFNLSDSWQLWRVFTFQFLHGNFGHLLSNGIGLFFFAPHVERWLGSRPFLVFYLLCGVAGALFYSLLFFLPGFLTAYSAATQMVGASAGLFGILAAFVVIAPDARVLLFFFIPLKMRTLGIGYFILEVFRVLTMQANAGGSAGHLGGAILGYVIIRNPTLREKLNRFSKGLKAGRRGKGNRKERKRPRRSSRDATVVRSSPIDVTEQVDAILDKISSSGIQSLTKGEREILDKARRK